MFVISINAQFNENVLLLLCVIGVKDLGILICFPLYF